MDKILQYKNKIEYNIKKNRGRFTVRATDYLHMIANLI